MKTRFTTLDVCASVTELSQRLIGMRVINVYDIDSKTYLIKLQRQEEKVMLLIESGNRIHTTEFEWPKSMFPSQFAMKLRKHIKQKRLVALTQLGIDRIVDLQFGSEDYAHHLVVELYDRGNIVLTDGNYNILNLLRKRIEKAKDEKDLFGNVETQGEPGDDGTASKEKQESNKENKSSKNEPGKKGKDAVANDDVKFSVGQIYPVELAKKREPLVAIERLKDILNEIVARKKNDQLKKALNPYFIYGHMLLENCLSKAGFSPNVKVDENINNEQGIEKVMEAIAMADSLIDEALSQTSKGYIVQRIENKPSAAINNQSDEVVSFQEFHPFLLIQHSSGSYSEQPSFDKAVDEFFSNIESQKLDVKALSQEKSALKKVENVKMDHEKRLKKLQSAQGEDVNRAELIELNLPLVDQAIQIVNSAIANQIDWTEIRNIVKEAQMQENPVACAIKDLKLETNHIIVILRNPYDDSDSEEEEELNEKMKKKASKGTRIDINLALSAYANAQSYYKKKKQSAIKEQKTIDHSHQAVKSAQRKAKQTIKEVATTTSIQKARKTFWFEKFRWFISSENYLVIGGRDQQQNELIVKRHLEPGDIYVHADLHGAGSIIVKHKPDKQPIPPKTLQEAGSMAVCYSSAWDSKIVMSAWWVYHDQVSKTAPTGEYLTTGSFMVRGKKNFLPPTYLIMGFGILLRLDDTCIEHHLNERRVRGIEDDNESLAESNATTEADEELPLDDADSDSDSKDQSEVDDKEIIHEEEEEEEDEGASLYPDTSIGFKVVSGKIQINREISSSSSVQEDHDEIFLGDEHTINLRENKEKASQVKQQKLSKSKKEEKGKSKKQKQGQDEDELKDKTSQQQQQQQQQQQKRGQKAKMNKIKDKYGDQDEEERRLRMEILASAGEKKESKAQQRRLKKMNKIEKTSRPATAKRKSRPQDTTPLPWEQPESLTEPVESPKEKPDDVPGDVADANETVETKEDTKGGDDNDDNDDDDQDVSSQEFLKEGVSLLDTLTGCPTDDDTLLFAVPVCAPYSAVINYKYKVKMTPGATKKGKGTKTAINAFIHLKEATQREKDLIKSVKDVDLAKYIPGKVKVSAPNLSKLKKK